MPNASQIYHAIYDTLCGHHPWERPWHFQWLATKDLHRELRRTLAKLSGRVLDVGCGQKPYQGWMPAAVEYVGLDIARVEVDADVTVSPGAAWPIADQSFDAVLCTQVLEHVKELDFVMREIARVLKPGGLVIISVPFSYNQHDWPHDYRRFSVPGTRLLLERDYESADVRALGGIGSTVGILVLNWVNMSLGGNPIRRAVKGLLLPIWIPFSGTLNLIGWLLDNLDRTGAFYGNVIAIAARTARLPPS